MLRFLRWIALGAVTVAATVQDEVNLLQAEVVAKQRKSAVKTSIQPSVQESGMDFCSGIDGIGTSGDDDTEAAASDTLPAAHGPVPADAEVLGAPSVEQRSTFALILEVLIVLIVLDGFKRWQDQRSRNADFGKSPASEKHAARAPKPATAAAAESSAWAALMRASLAGDAARVESLLVSGAAAKAKIKLSQADAWGCTALHAAAGSGSTRAVRLLLESGADVRERDAWDDTPLHLAARAGHKDACEILLAFGAEIDALNAQDWTPLVVASDAGQQEVCVLLMSRGASVGGLSEDEQPCLIKTLRSVDGEDVMEGEDEGAGLLGDDSACY